MATFKWLWTPPTDKTRPYNDSSQSSPPFPTTTLYILGEVDPYVTAGPTTVNKSVYNSQGNVKDGFSSSYNPSYRYNYKDGKDTAAYEAPVNRNSELPHRKILAGSLESDGLTRVGSLAPTLSYEFHVTDTSQQDRSYYGTPYGYIQQDIYPITLARPDPMVRPDLGDTAGPVNQFVYDFPVMDAAGNITSTFGTVSIPASITIANSTKSIGILYDPYAQSDLAWLSPSSDTPKHENTLVDWRIDTDATSAEAPRILTAVSAEAPYTYSFNNNPNTTNTIRPNITGLDAEGVLTRTLNFGSAPSSTPVTQAGGLPLKVEAFGNHTVTLGVRYFSTSSPNTRDYNPSEVAHIQTFFDGTEEYWKDRWSVLPGTDPIPNWWYYDNQIYPVTGTIASGSTQPPYVAEYTTGVAPNNQPVSYNLYDRGPLHQSSRNSTIYISAADAHFVTTATLSATRAVYALNSSGKLKWAGNLLLPGILQFAAVCGHEQGHIDSYVTNGHAVVGPDDYRGYIFTLEQSGNTEYSDFSNDGDHIWDGWEKTHGMDATKTNSTEVNYPADADSTVADDQAIADIQSVGYVMASLQGDTTHPPAWQQDWDNEGCQYGMPDQPYYVVERYGHKLDSSGASIKTLTPLEASSAPTFYLRFKPSGKVPIDHQLYQDSFGYYEVRNLADLKKLFSKVETDITNWVF